MNISRFTELQNFLEEHDAKARKSLSQNFLIDGNIVRKIIKAASIKASDFVIEVGPGPGALTEALLETGATVTCIEKDRKFANALSRFQTPDQRLTVFEDDALTFDLTRFGKKAKLVSNLPYHLTTPLLLSFLPLHEHLESLTIMVQKEVATRFTAKPGTPEGSSISLLIRLFSDPKLCFDVAPSCFFPKPSVTSSVVHLTLKPPPADVDIEKFTTITRTAFNQRRKMLRGSLKKIFSEKELLQAFAESNIDPTCRPEKLSLEQFITLYHRLFPLLKM